MPWSHTRKAEVLLKVIHPAVSFGCGFVSTAPSTCSGLRGKYSSAVWGLANARNHFLAPILALEKQYDPFILFLMSRLSTLRRQFCLDATALCESWNSVLQARSVVGPLSYLFAQLRSLSWEIQMDCTCSTPDGVSVNLCLLSKKSLREMVLNAWWLVLCPKLPIQQGYQNANHVNLMHTVKLRSASKALVPILGSFTVGAAQSTKQKRHFLPENDAKCRCCGFEDSYNHRLRHCPHYATVRDESLVDPHELFSDDQFPGL